MISEEVKVPEFEELFLTTKGLIMLKKNVIAYLIIWNIFFLCCKSNKIKKDLEEARERDIEILKPIKIGEIKENIPQVILAGIKNDIVVMFDGSLKGGRIFGYSIKKERREFAFGKIGEGPGEFIYLFRFGVQLYPNFIVVNSPGKESYFNYKGTLLKEDKVPPEYIPLTPFGENYVAMKWNMPSDDGDDIGYDTRKVVMLDKKYREKRLLLNKDLKIFSKFNKKKGVIDQFHFTDDCYFRINSNRIYVGYQNENGIEIGVFDSGGEAVKKIEIFFKKRKLSEEIKRLLVDTDFEKQANWGKGIKREVHFFEYETPVLNFSGITPFFLSKSLDNVY